MKYNHILKAISESVWAIHPPKLEQIIGVIEARSIGVTLDSAAFEAAEQKRKSNLGTKKRIHVMGLHGTISQHPSAFSSGGTSTEAFGREFDAAMANPAIDGILIDADSPGGSVFGVPELADKIRGARGQGKNIVAVANAEAHSAAYWLATAADELWVTPSGMVGSVGVVMAHVDQSAANESEGFKVTYVTAGKYKVEGNSDEPLGEEARSEFQRHVDRYYGMFVRGVAANRGITPSQVEKDFGQGRVVGARDAVERGMADRVGTLEEAFAKMTENRLRIRRGEAAESVRSLRVAALQADCS